MIYKIFICLGIILFIVGIIYIIYKSNGRLHIAVYEIREWCKDIGKAIKFFIKKIKEAK